MEQGNKIDLKKRVTDKSMQEMNGFVSFTTHTLNEKNLDELASMSELLDKVGISLEINRHGDSDSGYDLVSLKVNKERYKKAMTRYAGRKADFSKKYDKYGECSVEELQEKLKSMPKTKIAQELGCSRMTLYRIIKNEEKHSPDGNMSIWHYTS